MRARAQGAQPSRSRGALSSLVRLHGGRDAITEGWRLLASTPAAAPAARLLELFDAALERGLGAQHLTADLAEVRGFAYYTGTIFHLYAPGPGEAIGAGGRYDELLARFGAPMPAMGFALDLDSLEWALRAGGAVRARQARVVVVGLDGDPRIERLRARRRGRGGARSHGGPSPGRAPGDSRTWWTAWVSARRRDRCAESDASAFLAVVTEGARTE